MMLRQLVVSLCFVAAARSTSAPAQCVHVTDGEFTCDYSAMGVGQHPIDFTAFDPKPQSLHVSVNGIVPYIGDTQIFSSTFGGINVATFDSNAPASLTLDCGWQGGLFISSGAFANMSHVQHFSIRNCEIFNIPSEAFKEFESLDYFKIENGNLDEVDANAWVGLNVERLTLDSHAIPRNLGKFEISYTRLSTNALPIGLLYNMKNLTEAVLRGLSLETVTSDVFKYNTKIKYIDLSDNLFTSFPEEIFELLDSLAEVHVENIPWDCTCENTWFVPYGIEKNISFRGDLRCSSGDGVFKYYYGNCVSSDPCDGITGIVMGSQCVSVLAIIVLLIALASAALSIIALVLIAMLMKTHKAADQKKRAAIGRWNQVIDSTLAWKRPKV